MQSEILTSIEGMFSAMLDGKFELILKEVKKQKKSGVIYIPMKYIGKKIILIVKNEEMS